ncbi:hypothetical protein C8Q70DRAFT_964518 [Cubamyces menziesii]|nr:hypothetical protein C8Q70DRAFT_964518 [Cubamyces menziesii]
MLNFVFLLRSTYLIATSTSLALLAAHCLRFDRLIERTSIADPPLGMQILLRPCTLHSIQPRAQQANTTYRLVVRRSTQWRDTAM